MADTYEFIAIVPDRPGTVEKRLENRPAHFERMNKLHAAGTVLMAGAALKDVPGEVGNFSTYDFHGGALRVKAKSREEVVALLAEDPYAKAEVWNVEEALICLLLTSVPSAS